MDRSEAYIGVIIDDLEIDGTAEPYRIFTRKGEHSLHIRHNNADSRLVHDGYAFRRGSITRR
ncbi:MAG: hypothetical protein PHN82_02720 [bacterium]|nr:hypothetical protein [bacterium]